MKAFAGVVTALLLFSSASHAQTVPAQTLAAQSSDQAQATAPVQQTGPVQATAPVQAADPVPQAATAQATDPVQATAPVQAADPVPQAATAQATDPIQATAPAQAADPVQQTATAQATDPAQETAPVQPIVAEALKPEADGPGGGLTTGLAAGLAGDEASPASAAASDSTSSTEAPAAASPDAVPAVAGIAFGPGAKLYLEPMDGFAELLSEAMTKKKVPVVLVHDRAEADFVMSGDARLKKPGWFKGIMLYPHAKEDLSIANAHTGEVVFAYKLDDKQESMSAAELYRSSAFNCAKHLKKAMVKKDSVSAD